MQLNLSRVVIVVAVLNLAYFGVEFAVALEIGSVSLFADSIDFLEDASLNLLIAIALGWSATSRARLGMVLADTADTWGCHCVDRVGRVHGTAAAGTAAACADGSGRPRHQFIVCSHAGAFPLAPGQFDARGIPVGPQRYRS